jgi:hypothetical protein
MIQVSATPNSYCESIGNNKKDKGKLHPITHHEGIEGSRGIALLVL